MWIRRFVAATLYVALTLLGTCLNAQHGSDESGTLVAVLHTPTFVAVMVDSKVTFSDPSRADSGEVAAKRKFVEIGHHSACTLSGYLGYHLINSDIASKLRDWVLLHPAVEIKEALPELLTIMAAEWDLRHFEAGNLPSGRRQGSPITHLYCGTVIGGKPFIVGGATFVTNLYTAAGEVNARANDWPLYIGGEFDTPAFNQALAGETVKAFGFDGDKVCNDSVRQLLSLTPAKQFVASYLALLRDGKDVAFYKSVSGVPSRDFTAALFQAVEANRAHVAAPNNVFILRSNGKNIATTIELSTPQSWR